MAEQSQEFERLQALFEMVADLPPEERESVLEQNCDDPEVRQRVMAILAGAELPESARPANGALPLNGQIGPYKLLELLGSGGGNLQGGQRRHEVALARQVGIRPLNEVGRLKRATISQRDARAGPLDAHDRDGT